LKEYHQVWRYYEMGSLTALTENWLQRRDCVIPDDALLFEHTGYPIGRPGESAECSVHIVTPDLADLPPRDAAIVMGSRPDHLSAES
jgi:hypothetical protein